MPATIDIKHEILTYTGTFEPPVLELWGNGQRNHACFYQAFTPHNVTLRDFQIQTHTPNASESFHTITVGSAIVKFFFWQHRSDVYEPWLKLELLGIPGFLDASTSWLKKEVPDFKFGSHSILYHQHSFLNGTTVQRLLATVNASKLELPGVIWVAERYLIGPFLNAFGHANHT